MRVEAVRGGEPTTTDGRTIFVRTDAQEPEALVEVVVQAGLVGAGSLDPRLMRSLARRRRVAERYLALEGGRIVADLVERLPGLADRLPAPSGEEAVSRSPEESLRRARSRAPVDPPPPELGALRAGRVLAAARAVARAPAPGRSEEEDQLEVLEIGRLCPDADEDVLDVIEATLRDLGSSGSNGDVGEESPGRDRERSGPLERVLESLPRPELRSLVSWLLRRFRAPVDEHIGGPQRDLPTGDGRRGAGTAGPPTVALADADRVPRGPQEREVGVYPEWDADAGVYRRRWCTVTEAPSPERAKTMPWARGDGSLRRRLGRLALGLERCRRQPQGDDIDLDAAVEMHVQLAVGSPPDERVYHEEQRRRRDLAVLVLLDASGSASEPSPLGGTVHDHQRAAAAALVESLHLLGDRVACFAFHSRGRARVTMLGVKGFEEPFGGLVLRRLGGSSPRGSRGSEPPSGTRRASSREIPVSPDASSSYSPTGNPTTSTATRVRTGRRTPGVLWPRPGQGASGACASRSVEPRIPLP
ncbi:MAG: nitric oxide reductase activation protein [Acidimicrobiia bacterium]|nr:nitric oxide reductase activation protein [Acidimicrobiia bacterium]